MGRFVLSVKGLAEVKKSALRRGVWYRTLDRVERSVLDLTVKVVDSIKSAKLANVLTAIIDKLQQAMESTVERMIRLVGKPVAQKLSHIAVSWGNPSALSWAEDLSFARYLAITMGKLASS